MSALTNATKWYPGDDVVDWICSDGYNWSPARPGAKWNSFQTIYQNFYNWASTKNKPLMVGEIGVIEARPPGTRPSGSPTPTTTLKTVFPKIKAVVYYDEHKAEDNTLYDWRLDSSASTYAAWNHLAKRSVTQPAVIANATQIPRSQAAGRYSGRSFALASRSETHCLTHKCHTPPVQPMAERYRGPTGSGA